MFIWDFVADTVLGQIIDWLYGQIVGFLGDFFMQMGSIRDTALNVIKGFLAASLFTTVPVELYKLSISLQGSFTAGITGLGENIGTVSAGIVQSLQDAATWQEAATSGVFCKFKTGRNPIDSDCSRELLFIQCAKGIYCISVFWRY